MRPHETARTSAISSPGRRGRDRVRRPPPVPAGRPRAARELEGDGAARRARRQRRASGAELGNRPAPRLVCRGTAGRGRHARSGCPATAALAGAYLRRRDQVGLLSFGGSMNWLEPSLGAFSSIASSRRCSTPRSCSRTCGGTSASSRRTSCRPRRSCSASPLLDERMVSALVDVRGRGADVAALEIAPEPFLRVSERDQAQLAYRIWKLRRAAVRSRFRSSAFRSSSGASAIHSSPCWRRCRHSGVSPGRCARGRDRLDRLRGALCACRAAVGGRPARPGGRRRGGGPWQC